MTFFDFLKDLIDSGRERLKTPITGAFVLSFLAWNWRSFAILFFSDAPIEDKIIVINHEYCTFWNILFPIFIALFYTLLVPKIMVLINEDLAPTKNKRVDDIYDAKEHTTQRRIKLAKKIVILRDAETGNKEKQELLDEIQSLKEQVESQKDSIKQINDTYKTTINQLNISLKDANSRERNSENYTDRYKFDNLENILIADTLPLGDQLVNEILVIARRLTFNEFQVLKKINIKDKEPLFFDIVKNNTVLLDKLSKKGILSYKNFENNYLVTLSEIGFIISNIIQSS